MSVTRFHCSSCQVILQLSAAPPAGQWINCPKCHTHFLLPAAESGRERITTARPLETAPPPTVRLPRMAEQDEPSMRTVPERSRTMFWIVLGSALACGALLLLGGVAGVVGWLVWSPRRVPVASGPPPAMPVRPGPPPRRAPVRPVPPTKPAEWFAEGNRRMEQGDLDGAIKAFTEAIKLDPRFAAAYCNRGLARSYKGDFDGGIADSTKSIELNPRDPFPFINRANARIRKGVDPKASIADADQALKLRPGVPAALINRGMARDLQGDFDGAIADFDEAITLLPTFVDAYNQRGQTWMKKKRWNKAEADFTEVLRLGGATAGTYQNRGVARMNQGNHQGAIDDFTAVLKQDPRNPALLVNRSQAHFASGDFAGAQADLDQALAINPALVSAHLLRGWLHLGAGQDDGAVGDAEAGLKITGWRHRQSPYLAILAHCGQRRHHLEEARRLAAEAIQKGAAKSWPQPILKYLHGDMSDEELLRDADDNDQRTEAHAYVGVVQWLSGVTDKAREHLQWVHDNGNRDFIEYNLAVLLLRRLEEAMKRKP